ncbi:hypothetical protein M422DRAFT_53014 [Sphaerobolus stellatus SS14]|uniref:Crossover junction endonuclease MUS81 n=1 Tax=Sphaerobolus stellatus (strain SS14) TaxID=990650 RepID=A0A0C9UEX9_SPHS4|nr:hypothetical protein M422DRAFT_54993 [Sphaerobolus stellatus SS14]KIJ32137.1 hypothetical protein M422DRAFT_53014 [Sphaerobolus stellatus SS14]
MKFRLFTQEKSDGPASSEQLKKRGRPSKQPMINHGSANTSPSSPQNSSSTGLQANTIQRGRVSDSVAPALPAVNGFNMGLVRQTTSHNGPRGRSRGDMMNEVADLIISRSETFPNFEPIIFKPNTYDISMFLDSREIKDRHSQDYFLNELQNKDVDVEKHALILGDVLWVARCKPAYQEQKVRLAYSTLKVFYLVEDYRKSGKQHILTEPAQKAVMTAKSSAQIVDRFRLKDPRSISDSVKYLAMLHKTICDTYETIRAVNTSAYHTIGAYQLSQLHGLAKTPPRHSTKHEIHDAVCIVQENLLQRQQYSSDRYLRKYASMHQ